MPRLFVAAFLVCAACGKKDVSAPSPVLGAISGVVEYHDAADPAWRPAVSGQPISNSGGLRTGPDGTAAVSFFDGSQVVLQKGSAFAVEGNRPNAIDVRVAAGKLVALVMKLPQREFRVHSMTSVAAVRGTRFEVDVEGSGRITWSLFSGRLDVSDDTGRKIELASGQKLVSEAGTGLAAAVPSAIAAPAKPKAAPRKWGNVRGKRLKVGEVDVEAEMPDMDVPLAKPPKKGDQWEEVEAPSPDQ